MLDIQLIRDNPDKVKQGIVAKGYDAGFVDEVLSLDENRRQLILKRDLLREKRNEAAKARDQEVGRGIKQELEILESQLREIEDQWKDLLYKIPNIPAKGVPEGDEIKSEVLRKEGKPREFDFAPKDHVELGEILDIIDISRAAKISGTRFGYLKNEGALLEFALVQFAMETLVKEGFTPVIPPSLIRKEMTDGLGYWHGKLDEEHTANENYYLVYDPQENEQGLYLIGTGEHSIVPMHSDEILDEKELPKKYVAFSPCFRREAGSYGKDTRGIFRVHQFDKVEMVAFVKPEDDETERTKLLSLAEGLMKSLGLSYQIVKLASGALAFPTAETIDIETWFPSENKYRETHSISTTTDFQARRLNIKHRKGNNTEFVHILNSTALAIGRTIIAILENYQQKDGSVKIPQILRKWVGKDIILPQNK